MSESEPTTGGNNIRYEAFSHEDQIAIIQDLVQDDLSEPYTLFVFCLPHRPSRFWKGPLFLVLTMRVLLWTGSPFATSFMSSRSSASLRTTLRGLWA